MPSRGCTPLQVVLTFSQQGFGNVVEVAVLLILMVCFDTYHPIHHIKTKTYYPDRLESVGCSCSRSSCNNYIIYLYLL